MLKKIFRAIENNAKAVFFIYMFVFVMVIVLKFPTSLVTDTVKTWMKGYGINRTTPQLLPFKTIIAYVRQAHALTDWFVKNLAVNILMFIPFGFLFPILKKNMNHKAVRVILAGCILSVAVEIFQYILGIGLCDIDDVILNTAGTAVGYGFHTLMQRYMTRCGF